jgi:hypothetical protein
MSTTSTRPPRGDTPGALTPGRIVRFVHMDGTFWPAITKRITPSTSGLALETVSLTVFHDDGDYPANAEHGGGKPIPGTWCWPSEVDE